MKNLSIMIKPASSLCNLRCKYCFYADIANTRQVRSFGIMTKEVTEKMLQNIRADLVPGDRITFAFQGGEPCMAGLDWFRQFVSIVDTWQGIRVSYALQTNATLLNDEWCVFLKQNDFLVGVSWDLLPECHDAARVDTSGSGTMKAVLGGIALLNQHRVEYNVLCTLTNFVARHPDKVWKQLMKHDIRYVQFTPCLDELDSSRNSQYSLTPERFAAFYSRLFDLWYSDFQKGSYRSVKLFDDLVNLLAYGTPTACGIDGHCQPQMVVEADGSVYPCDFYCTEVYRLGNLTGKTIREIFESPEMNRFVRRPHAQPALCGVCEFTRFCGGNCKRMQRVIACEPDAVECGYRRFLFAALPRLQAIARREGRRSSHL